LLWQSLFFRVCLPWQVKLMERDHKVCVDCWNGFLLGCWCNVDDFWSQVRSVNCRSFWCIAFVLKIRMWDRFAVAEMIASAEETVRSAVYLHLKNTVADIHVVQKTRVHTVQLW
jgi:hypothetical protein